jgi:DtxR family Mn-dependent transcriptional regulator
MEDYLEVIHHLCEEEGLARVKDIAARVEVTNPSVVGAIKTLKRRRLVHQEHYGYIRLTERGQKLAAAVRDRHEVVSNFLENILGLDPETASKDACKIEHAISQETMKRLEAVAAYLRSEGSRGPDWREEFSRFYQKTK